MMDNDGISTNYKPEKYNCLEALRIMTRAILLTLTLAIAAACAPGQGDQLRAQTDMLLRQNNIDVDLNELTTSEVTSINVALSDGDVSRTEKRMRVEAILRNKERRRTDEPALVIGSLPPV